MCVPQTTSVNASPGQITIHGARNMKLRFVPLSIAPHEGWGGGTPYPRKLRTDSVRMTPGRRIVNPTMSGAAMFGNTAVTDRANTMPKSKRTGTGRSSYPMQRAHSTTSGSVISPSQ